MERRPFYAEKQADISVTIEFSPTLTIIYLGYCKPGTVDIDSETWSILRITTEVEGIETKVESKWANGYDNYDLKFSDYGDYDYYFRKY